MTNMTPSSPRPRGPFGVSRRFLATTSLALSALALAACSVDELLEVEDVDVSTPESAQDPAAINVVYAGALAEVQNSYTCTDCTVTLPGLLTDELRDIDTFPTRIEVDQRAMQDNNGTVQEWYRRLHRARAAIGRATGAFAQFAPSDARRAELHALHGFILIHLAENFCNGIALSSFDGEPQYGDPLTVAEVFTRAISQFDSALTFAANGSAQQNLARVGKGRALLNRADFAGAAAAVANVPVDFKYFINNSENSARQNNGIHTNIGPLSKRFAVAERDGANGLPFRSEGWNRGSPTAGDVRIRYYLDAARGQDGVSIAFYTLKYPSRAHDTPLAEGIEAQLIIAENQLRTGGDWLGTLNALRSNMALLSASPITTEASQAVLPLAPLTDPGTQAAREDLIFKERAYWMFLTGHRLGDLRRLVRAPYSRAAESVFPTGTYGGAAGGSMGTDVNFLITNDELNNPKAPRCTDRNP
jgi:hypothetical protein